MRNKDSIPYIIVLWFWIILLILCMMDYFSAKGWTQGSKQASDLDMDSNSIIDSATLKQPDGEPFELKNFGNQVLFRIDPLGYAEFLLGSVTAIETVTATSLHAIKNVTSENFISIDTTGTSQKRGTSDLSIADTNRAEIELIDTDASVNEKDVLLSNNDGEFSILYGFDDILLGSSYFLRSSRVANNPASATFFGLMNFDENVEITGGLEAANATLVGSVTTVAVTASQHISIDTTGSHQKRFGAELSIADPNGALIELSDTNASTNEKVVTIASSGDQFQINFAKDNPSLGSSFFLEASRNDITPQDATASGDWYFKGDVIIGATLPQVTGLTVLNNIHTGGVVTQNSSRKYKRNVVESSIDETVVRTEIGAIPMIEYEWPFEPGHKKISVDLDSPSIPASMISYSTHGEKLLDLGGSIGTALKYIKALEMKIGELEARVKALEGG